MKKIATITFIVLLDLGIVGAFIYSRLQSQQTPVDGEPVNPSGLPPAPPVAIPPTPPAPAGDTITLQTSQGGVVVKNFYNSQGVTIYPTGVGLVKPDYIFYYDREQGFFSMVLVNPDKTPQEMRQEAETDFLAVLGITQEAACKLQVNLTVDPKVDENIGGAINYGLSFCLGSKTF